MFSRSSNRDRGDEDGMAICDFSNKNVKRGWGLCSVATLITVIVLISVSLKKLSSIEYGVEYDRWAKTLDEAAEQGGLHVGPPGFRFIKFPSTQISAELSDTCVSKDGLRVGFAVTFQYQMPAGSITSVIKHYRDYKTWSTIVEAVGNSAVQHTCSEFNVTDFQSLRNVIQDGMLDNLRIKLEGSLDEGITEDGVYALASSLQLRDIQLPELYKTAVSDKQRAEEDISLAKNQRTQESTKAQTELLASREEARKILDKAYNDGNVTIIQADLKAEETTFAFQREQEVLVKAKEQFNLGPNGILAYMTNQLYASTRNLDVVVGEPAKISRKNELQDEL
jgi:regulator of protease activity HflC (stomatin/prohibitin superfamily)